ncbi:hypothetical protein OEIGOIKO_00535 [Streptomyces chrestomyceticus JCM 4735]|uniref:SnoaL-like domain-containing protein n=1 Tax=Streptomyces chrestomyceticus JCM 4735 TaxID=1306181 RepID=A0A7U9KP25_9ACTN|nr:nuclear transport factor 2 family protein [Streptomyces chrestomyceticus]GCD32817.1 hypothetical protein OEIGOIKO_00535 [Streptomyces chrestomyceticus JCM 4735]
MNRSLIEDAFQALASSDPGRISAVFTEDAQWLSPPGNATVVALKLIDHTLDVTHHMVGRKAIVRFWAEDFPRLFVGDLDVTFHTSHADGQRGIAEATVTATLANGNHYVNDYCFVFAFRNGLIHRVREYTDTARGHRMTFASVPP